MPLTDPHSWTNSLLDTIDAPRTSINTTALVLWQRSEGVPDSIHNPLATGQPGYGGVVYPSAPAIKIYPSWADGVDATAATIKTDAYGYPAILAAFRAGNSLRAIWEAVNRSQWCSGCQSGRYPSALYAALGGGGNVTGGSISGGDGGGHKRHDPVKHLIDTANWALTLPQSMWTYGTGSNARPFTLHINSASHITADCSAFVIELFQVAGWQDPSGNGFDGYGWTGDILPNGVKESHPDPGFLAFWSGHDHVALCLDGGGTIIEFGGPPAPVKSTVAAESAYHSSFDGYYSYHKYAASSINEPKLPGAGGVTGPIIPVGVGSVDVGALDSSPWIADATWRLGYGAYACMQAAQAVKADMDGTTYCTTKGPH